MTFRAVYSLGALEKRGSGFREPDGEAPERSLAADPTGFRLGYVSGQEWTSGHGCGSGRDEPVSSHAQDARRVGGGDRSGLATETSRREGLRHQTLLWWKWRLGHERRAAADKKSVKKTAVKHALTSFLPIEAQAQALPIASSPHNVVVELPHLAVRVAVGADPRCAHRAEHRQRVRVSCNRACGSATRPRRPLRPRARRARSRSVRRPRVRVRGLARRSHQGAVLGSRRLHGLLQAPLAKGRFVLRRATPGSDRIVFDGTQLSVRIAAIHEASGDTYGSPGVRSELEADGVPVGRKRVARLMAP